MSLGRRRELISAVDSAFKDPVAAKAHATAADHHLATATTPRGLLKRMAQCVATHLRATGHHYPCSHDADLPVNPGETGAFVDQSFPKSFEGLYK